MAPKLRSLPSHDQLKFKKAPKLKEKLRIKTKLRLQRLKLQIQLSAIQKVKTLPEVLKILGVQNNQASKKRIYELLRDRGIMGASELTEDYSSSKDSKIINAFKLYYSRAINNSINRVNNQISENMDEAIAARQAPPAPRPKAAPTLAPASRPILRTTPRPTAPRPKPPILRAKPQPKPKAKPTPKETPETRAQKAITEIIAQHRAAVRVQSNPAAFRQALTKLKATLKKHEVTLKSTHRQALIDFYQTYITYRPLFLEWPNSKIRKANITQMLDLTSLVTNLNSLKSALSKIDQSKLASRQKRTLKWFLSQANNKIKHAKARLSQLIPTPEKPKSSLDKQYEKKLEKLTKQFKPNKLNFTKLKQLNVAIEDAIREPPLEISKATEKKYEAFKSLIAKEIDSLTNEKALTRFIALSRWKNRHEFQKFKALFDRYNNDFEHWDDSEKAEQINFIKLAVKTKLKNFRHQIRQNLNKPKKLATIRENAQTILNEFNNLNTDDLDRRQQAALKTWIAFNRGLPHTIDLADLATLKHKGIKISRLIKTKKVRNKLKRYYSTTQYRLTQGSKSLIITKKAHETFTFPGAEENYTNLTDATTAALAQLKKQAKQSKEKAAFQAKLKKHLNKINSEMKTLTGLKTTFAKYNPSTQKIELSYNPAAFKLPRRKIEISQENWNKKALDKIITRETIIIARILAAKSLHDQLHLKQSGTPELIIDEDTNEITLTIPSKYTYNKRNYSLEYKFQKLPSKEKTTIDITFNTQSKNLDVTNKTAAQVKTAIEKTLKLLNPTRPDFLPSGIEFTTKQLQYLTALRKKNIEKATKLAENNELSKYFSSQPFAASGQALFLRTKSGARPILSTIPPVLSITNLNAQDLATYLNKNFEKAYLAKHPGTNEQLANELNKNGIFNATVRNAKLDEARIISSNGGLSIGEDKEGHWWVESIKGPANNTDGIYRNFSSYQEAIKVMAALSKEYEKAGRSTYNTYKSGDKYYLNDRTWPRSDTPLKHINSLPSALRSRAYDLFKDYRQRTKKLESTLKPLLKKELILTDATGRPKGAIASSLTLEPPSSSSESAITINYVPNSSPARYSLEGSNKPLSLPQAIKLATIVAKIRKEANSYRTFYNQSISLQPWRLGSGNTLQIEIEGKYKNVSIPSLPSGITKTALLQYINQAYLHRLEHKSFKGHVTYAAISRYAQHLPRNQKLRLHQTAYHLTEANKFFNSTDRALSKYYNRIGLVTGDVNQLTDLLPLMIRENHLRTLYSPEAKKLSRRLPHMKDGLFQLYNFKNIHTARAYMNFQITKDLFRIARRAGRSQVETLKARLNTLARQTFSEKDPAKAARMKETLGVITGILYFQSLLGYEVIRLPRSSNLSSQEKRQIAYAMFNMGPTSIRKIWRHYSVTSAEGLMSKLARLSRAAIRPGSRMGNSIHSDRAINAKYGISNKLQGYFHYKRLSRISRYRHRANYRLGRKVRFAPGIRPEAQKPAITYLYVRQISAIENDLRISPKKIAKSKTNAKATLQTPTPRPAARPQSSKAPTHTIKTGESLWKIARKYAPQIRKNPKYKKYTFRQIYQLIKKANKISHSRLIHPGQKLTIPGTLTPAQKAEKIRQTQSKRLKNHLTQHLHKYLPNPLQYLNRIAFNRENQITKVELKVGSHTLELRRSGNDWKIPGISLSMNLLTAFNNGVRLIQILEKFKGKTGVFEKNRSINPTEIQFNPAGFNFTNDTALKTKKFLRSSGFNVSDITDQAIKFLNKNFQ